MTDDQVLQDILQQLRDRGKGTGVPNLSINPDTDKFNLPTQTIPVTDVTHILPGRETDIVRYPAGTIPIPPSSKGRIWNPAPSMPTQVPIKFPIGPLYDSKDNYPIPIREVVVPKGAIASVGRDIPSMGTSISRTMRERTLTDMQATTDIPNTIPAIKTKELRTFSGADITCVVHVLGNEGKEPFVIANAQTLSYSIHREKVPVRAIGHTYPMGYTRGGRMIAGSIIFTMLDREILWDLIQAYAVDVEWDDEDHRYSAFSPMLDQLPPFDISITFSNEYGDMAVMAIYGVELVDEGTVLSIDDLIVEKTCSWVARDIDMLRPYDYGSSAKVIKSDGGISMEVVSNADMISYIDSMRSRRNMIGDDEYFYDIPYDAAIFQSTAAQRREYEPLHNAQSVTYTINNIRWMGTVYIRNQGSGVEEYTFVPDTTSNVGYMKLPGTYSISGNTSTKYVHTDGQTTTYSSTGVLSNVVNPDVNPKYLIDGRNIVDRSQLEKR